MRLPVRFQSRPKVLAAVGDDVAAVATIPADANESHAVSAIHVTYTGGAGAIATTVQYTEDGTVKTLTLGHSLSGNVTQIHEFKKRLVGDQNTAVVVTIPRVAGRIGTVEVFYDD